MSADPQRLVPPPTPALLVAGCGLALVVGLTVLFQQPAFAPYRVWNLSVVGAVALFAAARLGLIHGILFAAAAVIFKDVAYYQFTNWWEPYPLQWLYFAGYAVAGWHFLRGPARPGRVLGTALGVSLGFFVVSNFVAWLEQALPYGYSLAEVSMKYAAVIEYSQDQALVSTHRPAHRAYLTTLVEQNKLFASGPTEDGYGALIVYEADSAEAVEGLIKADPFFAAGVFVTWTVRPWKVVFFNPNLAPKS